MRSGVANDCVIEGERSILRCLRKLYLIPLIPLLYCFASLNEICYTTEAKEIVAKGNKTLFYRTLCIIFGQVQF
jgi:hypothetical protein